MALSPRLGAYAVTVALGALLMPAPGHAASPLPAVPSAGSYAVVVSESTAADAEWAEVVSALRATHDASLIIHPDGAVRDSLPALKRLHPRYAAFVARPEEAGRRFVIDIHRMTRSLDDDPYTDLRWGIVTGYEAADALRIVKRREPLIVSGAASSMGPGAFNDLEHGFASSETNAHEFWIRRKGSETEKLDVAPDPIRHLADAFNTQPPDLFQTSGHATEKDWQVGYTVPAGSFRCEKGQLYGLSTDGKRYDITSPRAKIYMPMGNCLIGHIPERDCMATAWMHTGGVVQMFGYTAVTFHGYMGWGIGSYFGNRYTLAEAFHFNTQALLWDLRKSFPEQADINFEDFDQNAIGSNAQKHGVRDRKLLGHLWDRDVVAFYGDPAWEARMATDDPAWTVDYAHEGENVTVDVRILKDGKWNDRPLAIPFPERLGGIRAVTCTHDIEPAVTDDFALLPVMGKEHKAGDTIRLRFGAHTLDAVPTSAKAEPIRTQGNGDGKRAAAPAPFDLNALGLDDDAARDVYAALHRAGANREELIAAIRETEGPRREDVLFLIANMPARDLRELSAGFLIDTVAGAREAYESAPWKDRIDETLYRETILPYANLSEKREPWRPVFREKMPPLVQGIAEPGAAAIRLNTEIYGKLNVAYHATKRPRPDMGPLESIEGGYASCTGLAILLVNACRAVGIPARVVGVARWTGNPGNHTWVEVWDGDWHCIGASESKALDDVWFAEAASRADESDPLRRIYAARFARDTLRFPLAWDPYDNSISAVDVTARYKRSVAAAKPAPPQPEPAPFRNLDMPHARSYVCRRAPGPVVVDGNIDKPVWQTIPWTDEFGDILGSRRPNPRFRTRAKMMWDDTCLYIAAELMEPHVWGTITEKNTVIFHDNDFEVFIDPDGDNCNYYEFEMNALNTIWELTLPVPYRAGGQPEWGSNLPGLKSAVRIDGTLNDPGDTDTRWCVEIAFPFADLRRYLPEGRPAIPAPGDVWRLAMSRVEWETDIRDGAYVKIPDRPEDNWLWTPQPAVDAHRPWTWGYVTFADAPDTQPFRDPAWHVKMLLMDIYDAQRERKPPAVQLADLGLSADNVPGLAGPVTIALTPTGWTASAAARQPDGTTVTWHTREDSRLTRD